MRPSLLIGVGVVALTTMLVGTASATWQYDPVYGGVTQYATPQSQTVTITRNGIGRHPTTLDYNDGSVTFDFQDNVAGQRARRTRTATGQNPTVSHFVFGGLTPMVEFEDSGAVHYTVGDLYVTVDSNNTVQTQYAVRDRLQSTRALLASDTTVSAQFGYDTLGKPTENDQACTASDCSPAHLYPYRFQGHQYLAWDDSSGGYQPGLTDNNDRFYSHDQGLRFMHTDIAGASIAPYTAYADDPVNAIDMDGTMPIKYVALILNNWLRAAGPSTERWVFDQTKLVDAYVGKDSWEDLVSYLSDPSIKNIFIADIHTIPQYRSLETEIVKEVNITVALFEDISANSQLEQTSRSLNKEYRSLGLRII